MRNGIAVKRNPSSGCGIYSYGARWKCRRAYRTRTVDSCVIVHVPCAMHVQRMFIHVHLHLYTLCRTEMTASDSDEEQTLLAGRTRRRGGIADPARQSVGVVR